MRKALSPVFPELEEIRLSDYKVRILTPQEGTKAVTRVMIETSDATGDSWSTVGVSANVVEASWQALLDSVEFKLHKDQVKACKPAVSVTDYSRANGVVKDRGGSGAAKRQGESSGATGGGNGRKPVVKEPKPRRQSGSQAGMKS